MLAPVAKPFQPTGGLKLLTGNLGHAVIKISAVKPERHVDRGAGASSSTASRSCSDAFKAGELDRDFVAVVRFQGPKANGMPELHKLTTVLGVLQDRGHKVALVTDGRMSGASGKVPAAIHVTPEALDGGADRQGARRRHDPARRRRRARWRCWSPPTTSRRRLAPRIDLAENEHGFGRELFAGFRELAQRADHGASAFGLGSAD